MRGREKSRALRLGSALLLVVACSASEKVAQSRAASSTSRDEPPAYDASRPEAATSDAGAELEDAQAADARAPDADPEPRAAGSGGSEAPRESSGTPAQPPAAAPERSADGQGAREPASEPGFDWPADCEQRYAFRAHGAARAGDTSKYQVQAGAQHLVLFRFEPPWEGDVQLLAARVIFDNPKITHHWTFFAIDDASVRDGEIISGAAQQNLITIFDATPILSVGPGANDLLLPNHVGMRMPSTPNAAFALELHYFNPNEGAAEEDASGIELCVASKGREQEAAMHSLGRVTFVLPAHQETEVTSTCRPTRMTQPVALSGAVPHMHGAGRRAKLVVQLAAGGSKTLLDVPYRASEQRTYPLASADGKGAYMLNPGDTLTTVCTFENETDAPIYTGPRIEDEMCTMMVLAWPAGLLTNGVSVPKRAGELDDTTCMEF